MELSSIQYHFFDRDIRAKCGISYSFQSPDIGQNPDWGVSTFWIFGQTLVKENCHNSRTSDNIDMKLGRVTKIDKRNKTMSQKLRRRYVSNCDFIVIFSSYSQFGEIRKSDSGGLVCKTISLTVTVYLIKTENRTKKSLPQLSRNCFE